MLESLLPGVAMPADNRLLPADPPQADTAHRIELHCNSPIGALEFVALSQIHCVVYSDKIKFSVKNEGADVDDENPVISGLLPRCPILSSTC